MSGHHLQPVIGMVPVIFVCGKCGLIYEADQGQFSHLTMGQFNCDDCDTKVFRWSGIGTTQTGGVIKCLSVLANC